MEHCEFNRLTQLSSFVVGTEGNVSYKHDEGFNIKKSGTLLKDLQMARCDIDGNSVSGKPSMEVSFHSWIYKNSNTAVIAHTHPTNTLKILCTHWIYEFANRRLFPDQVVFNGVAACVVPYDTPGKHLANAIEDAATDFIREHRSFPNLFLLQNHGIICCADTPQQAIIMTEICEKAAEVFIGAKLLTDECIFLDPEDVMAIDEHDDEIYRKQA